MLDFEKEFQTYLHELIKEKGITDVSEIDDEISDIYEQWLDTPQAAFLNKKPRAFFSDVTDPIKLIEVLGLYVFSDIAVPGPLLNRILDYKDQAYPILLITIKNYHIDDQSMAKLVLNCIGLIGEMKKPHPISDYVRIVKSASASTEVVETMVEILRAESMHEQVQNSIKHAYLETTHEFSKDCLLDIISEIPNDEQAYEYALDCFLNEPSKSWLYAHMLAKIGNFDCEPYLIERLKSEQIDYYNYCQVKEALEEIGGVCDIERKFDGDVDFEKIVHDKEEAEHESEIEEDDYE
jgi:hypothetical protein